PARLSEGRRDRTAASKRDACNPPGCPAGRAPGGGRRRHSVGWVGGGGLVAGSVAGSVVVGTQLGSFSAHGVAGALGSAGGGIDGSAMVGSGVVVSAGTVVSAGATVPVLAGSTAGCSSRRSQAAQARTSTAQSRGIRMAVLHGCRTCGQCMKPRPGFGRCERARRGPAA